MNLVWIDYNESFKNEIETWTNDVDTKRYACDSWHDSYLYYLNETEHYFDKDGNQCFHKYQYNKDYFCKIVLNDEDIIAVLIMLGGDNHPLTINPIIINPLFRNQGYCTAIIKNLIQNIELITSNHFEELQAGIDLDNKASIVSFTKCGFELVSVHPDGDFANYKYCLNNVIM